MLGADDRGGPKRSGIGKDTSFPLSVAVSTRDINVNGAILCVRGVLLASFDTD